MRSMQIPVGLMWLIGLVILHEVAGPSIPEGGTIFLTGDRALLIRDVVNCASG